MLSFNEKLFVGLILVGTLTLCGLFVAACVNLVANPIV